MASKNLHMGLLRNKLVFIFYEKKPARKRLKLTAVYPVWYLNYYLSVATPP